MTYACDTELCDTTHDQSQTRPSELSAKISTHPITPLPWEAFASQATKVVVARVSAILTIWKVNYNHPHHWLRSEDILAIQ